MEWYDERHSGVHLKIFGLSTVKGLTSSLSWFTQPLDIAGMEMGENNYGLCFWTSLHSVYYNPCVCRNRNGRE